MKRKAKQHRNAKLPMRRPKKTGKRGPHPEEQPGTEPQGELIVDEQQSLPGMEDAAIDDLENAARSYASVRDRRMALTKQEVDANALVLKMMKEYGKTTYRRDGIEIYVVTTEEKAKVRVSKDDE
jgi:hypothetical protein